MQGLKFGKWTVVKEFETQKPGRWYECLCDCGTIKVKAGTELRAGRSTQCPPCQYKMLYDPDNEIDRKYGKWEVIKFIGVHRKLYHFEIKCECGNAGKAAAADLRSGKSRQCSDCHNRENAFNNTKHGKHKTLQYKVWSAIHQRCKNPKSTAYKYYGERGISVCERWNKFENFLEDMGERPEGMTLDRIDNDGNYEPSNCRWVTHQVNCNNRVRRMIAGQKRNQT